jgi:hypothetical protein
MGNYHVRFLGVGVAAMLPPYPTEEELDACRAAGEVVDRKAFRPMRALLLNQRFSSIDNCWSETDFSVLLPCR